jgi:AraC-like DNA-binding protein
MVFLDIYGREISLDSSCACTASKLLREKLLGPSFMNGTILALQVRTLDTSWRPGMQNVILVVGDVGVGEIRIAAKGASVEVLHLMCAKDAWTTIRDADCILGFWDEKLLSLALLKEYMSRSGRSAQADFVVVGTNPEPQHVIRAFKAGIRDYIIGPLRRPEVCSILETCPRFRRRSGSCLTSRIDVFLEQQCHDPNLSMSRVAEQFGISPGYVGRLYRDEIGLTFRERLTRERLERARVLVTGTNDPMCEIAETCGFRSPSRFSEAFASSLGMPPRQFRYEHRTSP